MLLMKSKKRRSWGTNLRFINNIDDNDSWNSKSKGYECKSGLDFGFEIWFRSQT